MVLAQGRRRTQRIVQPAADQETAESEGTEADDQPDDDSRDDLEPWVEWIKRVTNNVEENLKRLKIRTWVEQARKRKWKFAFEIFSGKGERKWTHTALEWNPQVHRDASRPLARRKPARPNLRWIDELQVSVKNHLRPERQWNEVCSDPDFWRQCEDQFVNGDIS